jgi:hypothetical protein
MLRIYLNVDEYFILQFSERLSYLNFIETACILCVRDGRRSFFGITRCSFWARRTPRTHIILCSLVRLNSHHNTVRCCLLAQIAHHLYFRVFLIVSYAPPAWAWVFLAVCSCKLKKNWSLSIKLHIICDSPATLAQFQPITNKYSAKTIGICSTKQ